MYTYDITNDFRKQIKTYKLNTVYRFMVFNAPFNNISAIS